MKSLLNDQCNVVSSWEVIHVNVCHHGDEELFEVQLIFN